MKNIIKEKSFDDALLIEGSMYTVGTNDGIQFKKVAFLGTRLYHGRPIMVFVTKEDKQITINPSYHSYTIEEEDEIVLEDQGVEVEDNIIEEEVDVKFDL